MTAGEIFGELDRLIGESAPAERPALALALTARLGALAAGMAATPPAERPGDQTADENLSAQEAARRLGLSTDYLYRSKLPFKVRIGRRVLFSAKGLERWNRQRREPS
jgi:predicted DNA-binding transcriptional regulator AlpA